jgi:hypothetical protein
MAAAVYRYIAARAWFRGPFAAHDCLEIDFEIRFRTEGEAERLQREFA